MQQGAKITMRNGRVYENMDLVGANNASGMNLMFLPRDHPMAWVELKFNDILIIDNSDPLAQASCAVPGLVGSDPAITNQSNKDIRDGDSIKDPTKGLN